MRDGLENYCLNVVLFAAFSHVHEATGDLLPYRYTKVVHIYRGTETMEGNVSS